MSTEVKILGKTYTVRSDHDASFAFETAEIVNHRMRELISKAGTVPTEKIAILTAMNLAGELLKSQKKTEEIRKTFQSRTQSLISILDRELKDEE